MVVLKVRNSAPLTEGTKKNMPFEIVLLVFSYIGFT